MRGASLMLGSCLLLVAQMARGDSDGMLACGPRFAVFDEITSTRTGRELHVVPLSVSEPLAVAASIDFPGSQPHQMLVVEPYVAVQTFSEVYLFEVDDAFRPALVTVLELELAAASPAGYAWMEADGDLLTVPGRSRTLALDLSTCEAGVCDVREIEAPERRMTAPEACKVRMGPVLFAQSRSATNVIDGIIYHDVYLVRRASYPEGRELRPQSLLVVASRVETIH